MSTQERETENCWYLNSGIRQLVKYKARRLLIYAFQKFRPLRSRARVNTRAGKKAFLFDPQRSQAQTFACRIIENKSVSLIRAAKAQKRNWGREVISLNENISDGESQLTELASTIEESSGRRHTGQRVLSQSERAQLKLDLAEINRELPAEMREVAAVLSHTSEFATSEVLGLSRRETASCVARLRAMYDGLGLAAG